jgi:hypothetical protein
MLKNTVKLALIKSKIGQIRNLLQEAKAEREQSGLPYRCDIYLTWALKEIDSTLDVIEEGTDET